MKIKKFKTFISLNLLICIFFSLCACGTKPKTNTSNIDVNNLGQYIKNNIVFKDSLQNIDDQDILKKLYPKIDLNYISEFCVYTSASGATAEERAIFKLKDLKYIDDMKQIIKTRINNQISNFENYIPEEVYKIKNSVINEDENIITYVSCDTPNDIENVLKKFYNKNSEQQN